MKLRALFEPGALFSFKDFRRLFLSSIIVTIGTTAFPMALAIVIIDSGGSTTTLGLVMAAKVLSGTGFVVFGGVWADRLKRKYVMIGADLIRAFLVLILIFVSGANTPRYWMALVVFLVGIGDAFGGPASSAIINTVLPDSVLQQGNVFRGAISRIGGIIGPAIGVGLVALIGARLTFLLTAGAFLISVALLSGVKESAHVSKEVHEPFIVELKDGLRTVIEMPWIGAMILMATFQLLVVVASETVLLPVITKREFSTNTTMAAASAAFALGATICSFYSLRIKTNHPGRVSLFLWSLFAAIPLSLAWPDQRWIVIAYLIGGISVGPWDAFWPIALQREVPKEKLGRVFAIDQAGSVGLMPLGMALVGPVTNIFGERNFLVFAAVLHLLVNILVYRVPGVPELKTPSRISSASVDSSNSEQEKP